MLQSVGSQRMGRNSATELYSHLYMTIRKTIALTIRTFVGKVTSLFFCLFVFCLYFLIHCLGLRTFSSKEQASFNFVAALTFCKDFGAQNFIELIVKEPSGMDRSQWVNKRPRSFSERQHLPVRRELRNNLLRTSLVVQWLRVSTSTAGAQIPSLTGEIRPPCTAQCSQNRKCLVRSLQMKNFRIQRIQGCHLD